MINAAVCTLRLVLGVAAAVAASPSASASESAHTSAAPPPFSNEFPWSRVPTMAQSSLPGIFTRKGMSGTGRDDDKVLRFYAENYALVVPGNPQPGKPGCLEPKIKDFADRVVSFNPNATVLVYMANNMHHGALVPPGERPDSHYLCGLDLFKKEWIATMDNGSYVTDGRGKKYTHNLSNPECRKWWLATVSNKTLGENVRGVFADNGLDTGRTYKGVSTARGAALLRGQQALLEEVRASGTYVIFNGIRCVPSGGAAGCGERDDFDALDSLLPHASAGYFEPWLGSMFRNATTGVLNAAATAHALHKMINVSRAQPSKGITFKCGPGPCMGYIAGQSLGCTWPFTNGSTNVPNEANGSPQTAAALRDAASKLITFPLACFLCAAGPRWHLDYTWGYTTNDFVPGEPGTHALPGQPNLQSYAPDNWHPALLRPPGTPLGECSTKDNRTFTREWSGVSVRLSVTDETATLTWKDSEAAGSSST